MPSLECSRNRALDGSILPRSVRSCELATDSEVVAKVHEQAVRLLSAAIGSEGTQDVHIRLETFHDNENCKCTLLASPV